MRKKSFSGLGFFVVLVVSFACFSKGDSLIGKWNNVEEKETFEFLANGVARATTPALGAHDLKYEVLGKDTLKIYYGSLPVVFKYKVTDKELTLEGDEGHRARYKRVK